jgi:integral membrane protein
MSCLGSLGWAGEKNYASGASIGGGLADGFFEHPHYIVATCTNRGRDSLIGRLPDLIFDGENGRKIDMSQIRVFRMIALAEGVSFLTLLCIAMPMKYFMGMPEVVRVVGAIHGGLFLLYVGLLAVIHFRQRWSVIFSLYAFVASIIPFGTFVLDKQLRAKEAVAN